jgi:hypothetical protein
MAPAPAKPSFFAGPSIPPAKTTDYSIPKVTPPAQPAQTSSKPTTDPYREPIR